MKKYILLLAILAGTLSCTKEIEVKDGGLGTEAAPTDVQKAINDALSNISIGDAKIGQYVSYFKNVRLELEPIWWHTRIDHRLTNIVDGDTQVDFSIAQDLWLYDKDTNVTDEKHSEFTLSFEKAPLPSTALNGNATMTSTKLKPAAILSGLAKKISLMNGACDGVDETDANGTTYDCIKYFNLKSSRASVPAPVAVAAKPNCMNLPNCQIAVSILKYDEVKWSSGKSVETVTVDAEIAREVADLLYVPVDGGYSYTPPAMSLCFTGPYVIDDKTYRRRDCTVLSDFQ